jgi:O-antigen ligase
LEVTPIGWVLIPLGIVFWCFVPGQLYWWMVFFLPFSATAVVNVGSGVSASGVQATIFFGTLWMTREVPRFLSARHSKIGQNLRQPTNQLRWFVLVAMLSLIMPIWINGRIYIEDPEFSNGFSNAEPLLFRLRNITQIGYLVYGVLLALLVAFRNSEVRELMRSVRIFLISSVFVSLWGFLQFFCSLLNITYPAYVFNTSATGSAQGYLDQLQDLGIARISSVATEPSTLAACLLIAFVFVLFAVTRNLPLISKGWDRFSLAIILGALMISTSTAAYLGLAVVVVVYIVFLKQMGIRRRKYVVALLALAGLAGLTVAFFSPARDVFTSLVVDKGETYSGIARAYSVALAAQYFLQYPILGLGWGSVTSHDLVFKLLSNTGLLGFSVFSFFLFSLLRRLWRGSRAGAGIVDPEWRWWSTCLLGACLVMVFTNLTVGFDFVFEYLWFLLGLAMSAPMAKSALSLKRPPPDLQGREALAT